MNNTRIALHARHGFLPFPGETDLSTQTVPAQDWTPEQVTVLSNLDALGFALNTQALLEFHALTPDELISWWTETEPALKEIVGDAERMTRAVVYKNFPREVLRLTDVKQRLDQILIYAGVPTDWLTEPEKPRKAMAPTEGQRRVLGVSDNNTERRIWKRLVAQTSRWTDQQRLDERATRPDLNSVIFAEFGFSENAARVASEHLDGIGFLPRTGLDVLKTYAARIGCEDISLRTPPKWAGLKRRERKTLLQSLNALGEHIDLSDKPEVWKRALERLHPGDFDVPHVHKAMHALYNKQMRSFQGQYDVLKAASPEQAMQHLVKRPGLFVRRFNELWNAFGEDVLPHAEAAIAKAPVPLVVGLRAHLQHANSRTQRAIAPRGRWNKMQILKAPTTDISQKAHSQLDQAISNRLKSHFKDKGFSGFALSEDAKTIRLPENDGRNAPYGRGSAFALPATATFLRTGSFWQAKNTNTVWFDNGWNFFDEHWKPLQSVDWTRQSWKARTDHDEKKGKISTLAAFSGDPLSGQHQDKAGFQAIDLYIERLKSHGVRYAFWSILCYSQVGFDACEEVIATLQWGDNPFKGKIYEPKRAQAVFRLRGDKPVALGLGVLDLGTREHIHLDVPLPLNVQSATSNVTKLQEILPALMETTRARPTLWDLFKDVQDENGVPVLVTDADTPVHTDKAFVLQRANTENTYDNLTFAELLGEG